MVNIPETFLWLIKSLSAIKKQRAWRFFLSHHYSLKWKVNTACTAEDMPTHR